MIALTQQKIKIFLGMYSRIIILLLICLVLSLLSDRFLTYSNIMNVLRQSSLLAIMSLGMTFAMLLGKGVDISIGSVVALTSCLASPYLRIGSSPESILFGLLLAITTGILIGIINGLLVAYVRLPGFLVTFGMREIARGAAYVVMHGRVVTGFVPGFLFIGAGHFFTIPTPVVITATMTILSAWVLKYTRFGREIYIVGSNTQAAQFSGIKVKLKIIQGFAISSLFATIAGLIYIARLNAAEAVIGQLFHLQAIAAVAIGGTAFDGGIGSPFGTIIGALIMTVLLNGMNLLNVATEWQQAVNGSVIILAVVLDKFFSIKATR